MTETSSQSESPKPTPLGKIEEARLDSGIQDAIAKNQSWRARLLKAYKTIVKAGGSRSEGLADAEAKANATEKKVQNLDDTTRQAVELNRKLAAEQAVEAQTQKPADRLDELAQRRQQKQVQVSQPQASTTPQSGEGVA